ncbi:MAG: hypothetical protein QM734_02350 [Cyclobacteriaceae bacterium]
MKIYPIFFLLLCFACGGSLSSEQRKKIRENMEAGAIKKISDTQLTEAAITYGRAIAVKVAANSDNKVMIDSLENKFNVEIVFIEAKQNGLRPVEKEILEAYADAPSAGLTDNIQKMGKDSLLYTKPMTSERPDGSLKFLKAIGVRMPKKSVILSIKE